MFTSLFSLAIFPYNPKGVYFVIYPSLQGNIEDFDLSIPLLRMIIHSGSVFGLEASSREVVAVR